MKISMFGLDGLYNYGCEAIVRGTYEVLKQNGSNKNKNFRYFSVNAKQDAQIIEDIPVSVENIDRDLSFMDRVLYKGVRIFNGDSRILPYDLDLFKKNTDLYVSIGGDIFTLPKSELKKDRYNYYNKIVNFGNLVMPELEHSILFGASVGPFGDYDKAVDYYYDHLKKFDYIFVREFESLNYLKSIGLKNAYYFPDPAFFVPSPQNNLPEKIESAEYIGINLSPLSLYQLYGELKEEHVRKLADLIVRLIKTTDYKILLIPHVFSASELDNDLTILKPIYKILKDRYPEKVELLPEGLGFLGTKNYLQKCAVTICARMHCNINSFCEKVPTLFLSYSQKSVGMSKIIYDNQENMCSVLETDKIYDKTMNLLNNKEKTSADFAKKRKELTEQSLSDAILTKLEL